MNSLPTKLKKLSLSPIVTLFSIILYLLPVFIINMGYELEKSRKGKFERANQAQVARAKLETMNQAADQQRFIENTSEKLKIALQKSFSENTALKSLKKLSRKENRSGKKPFNLFLLSTSDRKTTIKNYDARSGFGKRQLTNAFSLLHSYSSGEAIPITKENSLKKMFAHLFGKRMIPEDVAISFRGKPFSAIINGKAVFFVWDFWNTGKTSNNAYFLIIESSAAFENVVLLDGLKIAGEKFSGYVRLFKKDSKDILTEALSKHKPFKQYKKGLKKGIDSYAELCSNGIPWGKNIDDLKLFCLQIPNKKWMSVILLAEPSQAVLPIWLFLVNLLSFFITTLFLSRRIIFGRWPETSLRTRFLAMILFGVLIPITLLGVVSSFYANSWLKSEFNRLENELVTCNLKIELQQQTIASKYRKRLFELLQAKSTAKAFLSWDESPHISLDEIFRVYCKHQDALPLLGIDVIDITGKKEILHFDKKFEFSMNYLSSFFHSAITENIRKNVKKEFSLTDLPKSNVSAGLKVYPMVYAMLVDRDFELELDKRRGEPVWMDAGDEKLGYIQSYFLGNDRGFSIQLFYSLKILYEKIFKSAIASIKAEFSRCYPAVFISRNKDNVPNWVYPSNCPQEVKTFLNNAVKKSLQADSPIKEYVNDAIVIAEPSRNFPGVTIVSMASTAALTAEFHRIQHYYSTILLFCFLTALILAYLLYLRIINPIKETSLLVKQIADENYESATILEKRNDEFGSLGVEISEMMVGLKERKQLATVLSDQALEAIESSTSGSAESIAESRSFKGVSLVTDIREFTAITEKFQPEIVTSMLNTHFAEMALSITASGGKIYKFIGDAIEAVFEVNDGENESQVVERALVASVNMLERLKQITNRRTSLGLYTYKIGIGLDFGELTTGMTGDPDSRLDFAVLGKSLKNAADLESRSKEVPRFPLVFSKEVADKTNFPKYINKLTENSVEGFYLKEVPPELTHKPSDQSIGESLKPDEKKTKASLSAGYSGTARFFFFALGLALIFLSAMNFHSFFTDKNRNKNEEHLKNVRKYDQAFSGLIGHENNVYFFLENYLCRMASKLGNSLNETADKDLSDLGTQTSLAIASYGMDIEKLFICRTKENLLEVALNQGGEEGSSQEMRAIAKRIAGENLRFAEMHTSFDEVNPVSRPILEGYLQKNMGLRTDITFLEDEMTYRIHPFTINNQEKIFFWAPLFRINPSIYAVDISKSVKEFRHFPPRRDWDMTGILMARLPLNGCVKGIIRELINFHDYRGSFIQVLDDQKQIVGETEGIPENLMDCETSNKSITIAGKKFEIKFFRSKTIYSSASTMHFLVWTAFSVFTLVWYQTVFYGKGFAATLRKQFSGIILASIIIPASFVLLTIESYNAIELKNLQQEALKKVKESIEQTELKQFLFPPLMADHLKYVSSNPGILKLIRANTPAADSLVRRYLNEHASKVLKGIPCPVQVSQAMFLKKNGTCIVNDHSEIQQRSSSSIVEAFGRTIFASINRGQIPNLNTLGQQAKDEMFLDAFIHVYRSIFGALNFSNLLTTLDRPVIQNAVSSCATVFTMPVPTVKDAECLAVWMLILADQRALLRAAAAKNPDEVAIFAETLIKMGHASFPNKKRKAELSDIFIRWVGHTGQQLNLVMESNKKELLVTGQVGIIQPHALLVGFYSLAQLKAELATTMSGTLAILFFGMGIAFFIIMIISEKLLSPVRQMIHQTKLLREQSYNIEIAAEANDELSLLCRAFNRMARQVKEKTVMKSLVSRHAGQYLADQMQHEKAQQGFRTNRIIMFLNIPQITELLENGTLDFAKFRDQIGKICNCIIANGGDIDKIMGNKLLVFFPESSEDSLRNSIRLANDLQNLEKSIGTRIYGGVHSGEVITGLLGLGNQRDFTMIGDPVNVAARIESAAEEAQASFLFSEDMVNLAAKNQKFEKSCSIPLKGKKGLFDLYSLK